MDNEHIYSSIDADIVKKKNQQTYEEAIKQLDLDAIQQQARRLLEMGLRIVVIPPTSESIEDDQGKKLWYPAIGKRPTVTGWPDAAFENLVLPSEIPNACNLGIQRGTPVERDGQTTGYVFDTDN